MKLIEWKSRVILGWKTNSEYVKNDFLKEHLEYNTNEGGKFEKTESPMNLWGKKKFFFWDWEMR